MTVKIDMREIGRRGLSKRKIADFIARASAPEEMAEYQTYLDPAPPAVRDLAERMHHRQAYIVTSSDACCCHLEKGSTVLVAGYNNDGEQIRVIVVQSPSGKSAGHDHVVKHTDLAPCSVDELPVYESNLENAPSLCDPITDAELIAEIARLSDPALQEEFSQQLAKLPEDMRKIASEYPTRLAYAVDEAGACLDEDQFGPCRFLEAGSVVMVTEYRSDCTVLVCVVRSPSGHGIGIGHIVDPVKSLRRHKIDPQQWN